MLEWGVCLACKLRRVIPDTAKRRLHIHSRNLQSQQSSVDGSDIRNFAKLSPEWAKEDGLFKALYSMNRLRLPLIVNTIGHKDKLTEESLSGLHIADIGCGGGILTFPLARLGANVTAIDASSDVIKSVGETADRFRIENPGFGKATFECTSVEDFAARNPGTFDAVVASEIIEHVSDAELFVESCVRLVHKCGVLIFTTINKTLASRIIAIWMAENILRVVPPGIHDWSKFVEPTSLRMILEANGCSVRLTHGMAYNPFMNRWSWIRSTAINYALVAIKD